MTDREGRQGQEKSDMEGKIENPEKADSTLLDSSSVDDESVGHKSRDSSQTQGEAKHHSQRHHGQPDIGHAEAESSVPGHALDVELGEEKHTSKSLARIETANSLHSRVSRVLSQTLSRRRSGAAARERIPFAPIPTTDLDAGVVGWDSQDDPAMPLNFTQRKKWLIVGLLSAITLLTPFASSILAPGIVKLNEEFGNDNDIVGTMTVSVYLLGYVVGPLFLAPLSELYGRRIVLSAANVFFCLWQIGCALAPSIEALIVFRFLTGVGGAGCLSVGAGVIADVFQTDERGFAIGIYTLGPLLGPTIGPVIGSFVSQSIGWRWDFWIVFIVSVVIVSLSEIFNQETNPRILMERKVKRLREELGRDDLRSCYEDPNAEHQSPGRVLLNGLTRPIKMLFLSPLVFFVSLYIAFTYGTLYLLFTTIPVVFQQTYGWSLGVTGLIYICFGLGNFAGWAVVTGTSDRTVVRRTKANKGVFLPEFRLPLCVFFGMALPPSFFWYGWSSDYRTHWIVPVIGLFPFAFGIIGVFMPLTTYLVDCYPMYAASAIAASTVIRSLAGMLLPLAGPDMYENLGLGWGNSLLGFLSIAMIPVPLLLYRFGGKLRKMGLQL
ncbi:hypothetical protein VTK26DRAFT_4064 [Humicola hyalothermophila]